MQFDKPIKQDFAAVVQSVEAEKNTITCVIVSGQTNRGRRRVDVKGCQWDDYFKSPVVLAFHDDEKVIARCLWLKIEDAGIIAKFEFRNSELAQDIFSLYKGGFLTSWSIGFLPVTYSWEEENGVEVLHIQKWILLEVSAVSVAMDANAITLAINQGLVHDDFLVESFEHSLNALNNSDTHSNTLKLLGEVASLRAGMAGMQENIERYKSLIEEFISLSKEYFSALKITEPAAPAGEVKLLGFQELSSEMHNHTAGYLRQVKGIL